MDRPDETRWFFSYLPQGIAGGATSALIPLFAYALGGTLSDVGLIATAASAASVPAFMLWGSLSDRLGRRKVFLLLGFLGSASCFLLMAASPSLLAFLLANLLIGFLGAASAPVSTVLVMESSEPKAWPSHLALLSRITATGWSVGLVLGGVWLALGTGLVRDELDAMRGLFAIGSALGFLSVVLAFAWTREPTRRVDRRDARLVDIRPRIERGRFMPHRILYVLDPRRGRRGGWQPRALRLYLVSVLLLFGGFTAFYAFFPIFLRQEFGLSSAEIFGVYVASQVSSVAVYPRVARLIAAKGSRRLQIYASLGRAVLFPSFFLLGLAPLTVGGWLAVAILLHAGVGICWAVINVTGSILVSRLAPAGERAHSLAAYNAVQGFGSIFGPLVGGFSAQLLGYAPAFGISAALVVCGCAILVANRGAEI